MFLQLPASAGRIHAAGRVWSLWTVLLATTWSMGPPAPAAELRQRLPRIPARTPADSMKTFSIIPGFRVEQVAAEPLVADPVDMAFDENGRLYVCEYIGYSENDQHKPGRVVILDDTDNDGIFDKRTVFAEQLSWNATVTCFDGGVFVGASPDLLYLKDTDGDDKADVREVVISGFGTTNVNQLLNSLRWRLDNRIHGIAAASGGELRALRWERGKPGRQPDVYLCRRRDFSFEPRSGQLQLESSADQHGLGRDDWGRTFAASNGNHCQMVMYEDRYIARNPYLRAPVAHVCIASDGKLGPVYRTSPREPWRIVWAERRLQERGADWVATRVGCFSAACGITVYSGTAFPTPFRGNLFIAEPSGNLVHRKRLVPDGVGFIAHRTEQNREFLCSSEIWFRPVHFTNAPDGTLYVADMYREIIEHPATFHADIKPLLDLNSGNDRGRIYRIVPEGFRQPAPPCLRSLPTQALVALLAHPNGWHRRTASRLLYERQDPSSIASLRELASGPSPLGRMHAMYALDGQAALSAEVVLARLSDEHPRVREHAVKLSEHVLAESSAVRRRLCTMSGDADPRVRYQLAFTLGEIGQATATTALAALGKRDFEDEWMRLAVLSSSMGRPGSLFTLLVEDDRVGANPAGRRLLGDLAEQAGRQKRSQQLEAVLQWLERSGTDNQVLAVSVVQGLCLAGHQSRQEIVSGRWPRAAQLLVQSITRAKTLAADEEQPVSRRTRAIRLLAFAAFDDVRELLAELLTGRQPQTVQLEALAALGRFRDDAVPQIVVESWRTFTPKVQRAATELLCARPERVLALLDALAEGQIRRTQLDPARLEVLRKHSNEKIRARANEVLGSSQLARRHDVVDAYRDVLTTRGNATQGKGVFKEVCAACHKLEGVGYDLGLPLTGIKERGADTILVSTLDPNREVQPQYMNYMIVTEDGATITGMIASESATSITLRRADGESDTVLRADIDEMANTGTSIMPEGLERQLTKKAMADLIAYLMAVK